MKRGAAVGIVVLTAVAPAACTAGAAASARPPKKDHL